MINIAFLTTNNVKLAHARYLCKDYDVNIIQHKLLHYGKGYEEPRLFDRDKLLRESVTDAIERWKKNVSKVENRLYFLEDTSLVVHGLSTENHEVPGVDVKYWMLENSFDDIDRMLKENGNNRHATVYSHLILVLSQDLKSKYKKDYVIFSSYSNGKIVDNEFDFETNKIYPWLDNKSFNKWFIPVGETKPISLLNIEAADLHDFRRGAFEEMLEFLLNENKIKKRKNRVVNPRLSFTPLFVISGPTCSGKTTIGKHLLEKYGYYHIEASDFMTLEFLETHGNRTDIDIGEFAKEVLAVKPTIVVDRIFQYLEGLQDLTSLVVTGFRTEQEVKYFETYSPLNGNIVEIFLDANYEIRYERWLKRNRDLTDSSRGRFDKVNELQLEIGLYELESSENISCFKNEGTFEDYYRLFNKSFLKDIVTETDMQIINFSQFVPRNLEDAVLLTLSSDFNKREKNYYTTTEIAHKINETFEGNIEKHKDNVSRYFNQKFYPYYELKLIDKKLKYRISPTGYSHTLHLIKKYYKIQHS